jgi:hypothetical protein
MKELPPKENIVVYNLTTDYNKFVHTKAQRNTPQDLSKSIFESGDVTPLSRMDV